MFSVVPPGLGLFITIFPALKRRAIVSSSRWHAAKAAGTIEMSLLASPRLGALA